jgi:hypothetical protein
MESFTVMLGIYNLSIVLPVTPLATLPFCFHIRTIAQGPDAITINRLADLSWNAENIQMEYFTLETIQRLGALIELEEPTLFNLAI